jgi:hypothetical protein
VVSSTAKRKTASTPWATTKTSPLVGSMAISPASSGMRLEASSGVVVAS